MENFNIENRYLKFCCEVGAFIRCMKDALFRPDYQKIFTVSVDQKTQPSICFKTCSRAFEMLNRAFETLGRAFEMLHRALSLKV